jgi:hypothetical protein
MSRKSSVNLSATKCRVFVDLHNIDLKPTFLINVNTASSFGEGNSCNRVKIIRILKISDENLAIFNVHALSALKLSTSVVTNASLPLENVPHGELNFNIVVDTLFAINAFAMCKIKHANSEVDGLMFPFGHRKALLYSECSGESVNAKEK